MTSNHQPDAAAGLFGQGAVFEAFERKSVRYCALRFQAVADVPEIDLLVDARHLPLVEKILGEHGYCPVLSWGNAPHSFFMGYDPAAGRWVKFDVVTDIRYGQPIRALCPGLTGESLRQRRRQAPVHVLAPEHDLIKLLLHCLIHERCFAAEDCCRLEAHFRAAQDDPGLRFRAEHAFEQCLAPAVSWSLFQHAAETRDWTPLLGRRRAVIWHLIKREPLQTAGRYIWGRLLRVLRPLWIAAHRPGVSIALLGADGAGKSTLARQLAREPFIGARIIYMGTNPDASTVALPGTRRLRTWAGNTAARRGPPYRALARAIGFTSRLMDQWFRYALARYHRRCGRFVVFDRFVHDADLDVEVPSVVARVRRRVLEVGCPLPDLLVLLDAPGTVLQARKKEDPLDKIERQREAYLRLSARLPELIVLDSTGGEDKVRREVVGMLWRYYRSRAQHRNR